jgi:hypothetical protein
MEITMTTNERRQPRPAAAILALCVALAACNPQDQPEGDIMKGGGGDVTEEEERASVVKALQDGKAWVCADAALQQTAVRTIGDKLDHLALNGPPSRAMSGRNSVQIDFDPQTKLMTCESEMLTINGEFQNKQQVVWTAQPSADGYDVMVGVNMRQFYSAEQAPFFGGF